MGPKTAELIRVLEQIASLLNKEGADHWCRWACKARARLLDSDYSGIEYVLSAYGGMGSFNDLVLGQQYEGGMFSTTPDYVFLNDKLEKLRSDAGRLAEEIRMSQKP